ncbi:MAG: WD40/YVTN/BNR-like repeat-containing protein [Bacteroidales bacterium]
MKISSLAGIFLVVISFHTSCSSDRELDDWQSVTIAEGTPLRGICFLSQDTGFAWGGFKNRSSFIKMTADGGLTWRTLWESSEKCIYTLTITPDGRGVAGGDSLFMLQSHDGGNSWFFFWLADSVPMHSFNRPAFRNIAASSQMIAMAAGENFKKGVLYASFDKGKTWTYQFYSHELTGVSFLNDSIALATGNGLLLLLLNPYQGFKPIILPFEGDFWTSAIPWKKGFLITSRSSSIYYFNPITSSLKKIKKESFWPGDQPGLSCITTAEGIIVAAGDRGYFCWSNDEGNTWEASTLPQPFDIHGLKIHKGFIWFATSGGNVYQLPLQQIKPLKN